MRKPKRDVRGYIDKLIEYERGNDTKAPPGGFASGLDRAEADLVYMSVRMTLEAVGVTLKPPWSPAGQGGEKKLADAYRKRGLNRSRWIADTQNVPAWSGLPEPGGNSGNTGVRSRSDGFGTP